MFYKLSILNVISLIYFKSSSLRGFLVWTFSSEDFWSGILVLKNHKFPASFYPTNLGSEREHTLDLGHRGNNVHDNFKMSFSACSKIIYSSRYDLNLHKNGFIYWMSGKIYSNKIHRTRCTYHKLLTSEVYS